jgi:Fe(3+) dicitrate transport protein
MAVTPGIRVESYHQKLDNQINQKSGSTDNLEVVPGIGATYNLSPKAQVFAGLYKGFSPAMVATAISSSGVDQQLDAERSTNTELGIRGQDGGFTYEVTAFQMDFENQIVNQSQANGITKANGGKTLNQGVEAGVGYLIGGGFRVDANATWLPTAKYNGASKGTELASKGNRLQYAPELVTNVSFSYAQGKLRTSLGAYHVSEQFADAANTKLESTDGTKGLIDAYTVYHLNAQYAIDKQTSLFGVVRNLTDEKYITSRKPDGIFPGIERNFEVGVRYKF